MFGPDFIANPLDGAPYGTALQVCLVLAFVAWFLSVVTRQCSSIDRLWPLCPPLYCLIVALATDFQWARVNLMTLLVVLWGARLTFNLARKGGYRKGGEDYRWAHVREKMSPAAFQVLNVTFIHPVQMVLLWLLASPLHRAWEFGDAPLGGLDFLAAGLFFVLLVGQTAADRQQWNFQQDKKRRIAVGEDVARPFLTTGLFRCSRHPNHFCEIAMWCVFHLFSVAASGQWLHWTGLGCIGLIMLLIPSLRMTEAISASKYPAYRDYQATTSALIPLPPKGRQGTREAATPP